jgi:hypothetical protein
LEHKDIIKTDAASQTERRGGQEKHIYGHCFYICSLCLHMLTVFRQYGAAANDAKFLTSSRSSAHIPNNFWSWTISSQVKEGREDKDKVEVGAKKESNHNRSTLPESNQLETFQATHI